MKPHRAEDPETSKFASEGTCPLRDLLSRIGDKWSVIILLALEEAPGRRRRFTELRKQIPAISQRMLTLTLRSLERDGLATRHLYAEVPPRVEYELTALGRSLVKPLHGLAAWIERHWPEVRGARDRYDRRGKGAPGAGI